MIYNQDNPRELPGFKKKSLLLPYGGSEIWFEHLDGMYSHNELVLEKLNNDRLTFCRPSYPSLIGFVLDETNITPEIISEISGIVLLSGKRFSKICFIGAERKAETALRKALRNAPCFLAFIHDFEKAKEWLVR